MQNHFVTAKQSKSFLWQYINPKSCKVDHRLKDVNGLQQLVGQYDLFILDRDCTLTGYHASKREPRFEETLTAIAPKAEIVSNSSFDELRRIRDVFGDMLPISKLVVFDRNEHSTADYLIRWDPREQKFSVMRYISDHNGTGFVDETKNFMNGDTLTKPIRYAYSKPDPKTVESVVCYNSDTMLPSKVSNVLMVGDRYWTDIVAGNLADTPNVKVDTALVKPVKPFSDTPVLIGVRVFDKLISGTASHVYDVGKFLNIYK